MAAARCSSSFRATSCSTAGGYPHDARRAAHHGPGATRDTRAAISRRARCRSTTLPLRAGRETPIGPAGTTLTVSVEASFTAVSIGYGVVPEVTPGDLRAAACPPVVLHLRLHRACGSRASGDYPTHWESNRFETSWLAHGRRVVVQRTGRAQRHAATRSGAAQRHQAQPGLRARGVAGQRQRALWTPSSLSKLFQVVSAPVGDVQFLYALVRTRAAGANSRASRC